MRLRIICIGGPTGAGKDTIASMFLEHCHQFVRIPRSTTRLPRKNEIHGYHYLFLNEDDFTNQELAGSLCGIDYFCGNRYGIDYGLITNTLMQNKNVLGIFGIKGLQLRPLFHKDMISVYITAPLETLYEHLISRGDPIEEISIRMTVAEKQIADELHLFDYVIYNIGTRKNAVQSLINIIS